MSEQQIITQLWELENDEEADQRAELTGRRYLSLFMDKLNEHSYVFRHAIDETGGLDVAEAEFWEYDTPDEAERVYNQLLRLAEREGRLVDPDSDNDMADFKTTGPELLGTTSDTDDPLIAEEP